MLHGADELLPGETFWRDHSAWLKECGYELRRRFQPGWVPSWEGTKKDSYFCEDGLCFVRSDTYMDAKETSTGRIVAMKMIVHDESPDELAIGTFLSSGERSSDNRNHCVPILRTLPIPDREGQVIIVMPHLRAWYDPRFKTIGEGMQFFKQMLEGLQFLHENHIAHCDGGFTNIMMDCSQMYGPESFHPQEQDMKYDFSARARHSSRTEHPPKYYFIDFGLSIHYKPDELPATICAVLGADKSVPEFLADKSQQTPKHDPFAVDVYYLGNAFRAFLRRGIAANYKIREKMLRGMRGFEFMEPLIVAMTEPDPVKRIKVDEAVKRLADIEKGLSAMTLRSRVVYNAEFTILRPFKAVSHWVWTLGLVAQGIPATPKLSPQ
ncbi:hypothetical protein ARMSODRAFT_502494 [Armillaria solidipes]|uniref:Protein kinase domain-containing protein n=1 Tax=Armillaria solidipes TaxID=1076256 RepID=A0A2H3BW19_9AGAR|nr:hypothetical protein ARMSODRAFT_502494 [Armillaria solidipes]